MVHEIALGALAGALVGAAGAWLGALAQYHARQRRNAIFFARGEPGIKDVVWRPRWRELGAVGAVLGALVAAVGAPWWWGAIAAAVAPAVLLVSAVAIVWRARRSPRVPW